jgi:hypothetical protein
MRGFPMARANSMISGRCDLFTKVSGNAASSIFVHLERHTLPSRSGKIAGAQAASAVAAEFTPL